MRIFLQVSIPYRIRYDGSVQCLVYNTRHKYGLTSLHIDGVGKKIINKILLYYAVSMLYYLLGFSSTITLTKCSKTYSYVADCSFFSQLPLLLVSCPNPIVKSLGLYCCRVSS